MAFVSRTYYVHSLDDDGGVTFSSIDKAKQYINDIIFSISKDDNVKDYNNTFFINQYKTLYDTDGHYLDILFQIKFIIKQ